MKTAKIISNEDAAKILSHMKNTADKLIFRLSVETGLRISDILELRAGYLDRKMYVVEKKTGKIRIVEISEELMRDLQSRKDYALKKGEPENYAFPSTRTREKHLHRSTYHRRLKRAAASACVDCSAHSGRKLYAKNIFSEKKSIFDVQEALNHKYITTTAPYLGVNINELLLMWIEQQKNNK